LEANAAFRNQVKSLAEGGLPIYAECGGLMYLGRRLVLADGEYEMTGVLPAVFGFSKRPQGHGYTIVRVEKKNPFYTPGQTLLGHEFHYSSVKAWDGDDTHLAFTMQRGTGFVDGKDGVCVNNVLATYTHIHALGTPQWAQAMVDQALRFKAARRQGDRV
jgi:cobyrinic acid a,c-diamide synthase